MLGTTIFSDGYLSMLYLLYLGSVLCCDDTDEAYVIDGHVTSASRPIPDIVRSGCILITERMVQSQDPLVHKLQCPRTRPQTSRAPSHHCCVFCFVSESGCR